MRILSTRIDPTSYAQASDQILQWARSGESRSVFCANVHMVTEGFDDTVFQSQVNTADLVTPDGMPMVWALRKLGAASQGRVYGPDLTDLSLRQAETAGLRVGFLGGTPETLTQLLANVQASHPALAIGYAHSPPFRPLSPEENTAIIDEIRLSAVQILFVGLGCPKQERWIAAHRDQLHCVALAVGAAFDVLARTKPQAPRWMQARGLEWLFRLASEPRRLWRRYITTNPRFIWHFGAQLLNRETRILRRDIARREIK